MTTKLEQAARQVLEVLVRSNHGFKENPDKWPCAIEDNEEAIAALREALTEQGCSFCNNPLFAGTSCPNCGRAVEPDHIAHVRKMVPDHIADAGKMVLTTEQVQQIEEALDTAKNGLLWYRSEYPEAGSGADDEAQETVDEALATIRAARAQADHIADADKMVREPVALPFNCWSTNDGDSWYEHPADAQLIYDTLGDDAKVGDEFEVTAGWTCVTARYRIVSQDGDDFEVECISHPQDNAAPVRTKDLTDDEIADVFRTIHVKESWSLDFARAVIAADREKNK